MFMSKNTHHKNDVLKEMFEVDPDRGAVAALIGLSGQDIEWLRWFAKESIVK